MVSNTPFSTMQFIFKAVATVQKSIKSFTVAPLPAAATTTVAAAAIEQRSMDDNDH